MAKVKRQIIQIDEEKCDGCGLCVPSCVEGALQVVDGKARLMRESFCDGLGVCLGDCPQGALRVAELETDAYDERAVVAYLQQTAPDMVDRHLAHLQAHGMSTASGRSVAAAPACPSIRLQGWEEKAPVSQAPQARIPSELRQWPVQLHLVPANAPFFQDADLTLVADCVPFAYPNFHADFLRGSAIAVGCPKLDDGRAYIAKVAQILEQSRIKSLKVVRMEVPCCGGLAYIAQQALAVSGKDIPLESVVVDIQG